MDKTDLALIAVADSVGKQLSNRKNHAQPIVSFMNNEILNSLELDNLRVADAFGNNLFNVEASASKPENIATRDFFVTLRDNATMKLVFSEPGSTAAGKWGLTLARRITRPDGTFAGVVYSVINPKQFVKTFASIDLGKDGSIALRNRELALIARYSKSDGVAGNLIGQKIVSNTFKELVTSGRDSAAFKSANPADNIERLYSYRKVTAYPLYIIVGQASHTYLAEWQNETIRISVAVIIFFFASLGISRYTYKRFIHERYIFNAYRESEESFRAVFDNSLVGTMLLTPQGQIARTNMTMENLLGYRPDELRTFNVREIAFPEDCDIDQELLHSMLEGYRQSYQVEKRFVSNYGIVIWGMLSASVVRDGIGNPRYIVYMVEDISARKEAEAQLIFQSTHDSITGLRNRTYYDEQFVTMQLGLSCPVSIIIIDLDGLKQINDSLGHKTGDRLIKAAATILLDAFHNNEIVARIGGDEFAVLLPKTDAAAVSTDVERLRNCQCRYNEQHTEFPVYFSIGAATAGTADQLSVILQLADDRMYAEKATHRSAQAGKQY